MRHLGERLGHLPAARPTAEVGPGAGSLRRRRRGQGAAQPSRARPLGDLSKPTGCGDSVGGRLRNNMGTHAEARRTLRRADRRPGSAATPPLPNEPRSTGSACSMALSRAVHPCGMAVPSHAPPPQVFVPLPSVNSSGPKCIPRRPAPPAVENQPTWAGLIPELQSVTWVDLSVLSRLRIGPPLALPVAPHLPSSLRTLVATDPSTIDNPLMKTKPQAPKR